MEKIFDYSTGLEIVIPECQFRNPTNYDSSKERTEINEQVSMTVPDMSFTIKEIVERFRRGVAPAIQQMGLFAEGDIGFDDADPTNDPAFDLADATQMVEEIELRLEEAKTRKAKSAKKADDVGGGEVKQIEPKSLG